MEQTLIIVKPDTVQRGLAGAILSRFERKGLQLLAIKMIRMDVGLAGVMYQEHKGKEFYEPLIRYMTSGPAIPAVLQGVGAVQAARALIGPTFGGSAAPGSIRGDFGLSQRFNLVHGSSSPADARREIALFFKPEEMMDYRPCLQEWIYAPKGAELI